MLKASTTIHLQMISCKCSRYQNICQRNTVFEVRRDFFKQVIHMFRSLVRTLKIQLTEYAIRVFNYLERNILMNIHSNFVTFFKITRGFWLVVILIELRAGLTTRKPCLRMTY